MLLPLFGKRSLAFLHVVMNTPVRARRFDLTWELEQAPVLCGSRTALFCRAMWRIDHQTRTENAVAEIAYD